MGTGEERHGLASPRFRRRLIKGGLLLAVVGAGALVSIFFWNTADPVELPRSNRPAQVYVPQLPVTFAASERKQVIQIASRFVKTAVKRDHSERAYELVGPNLRAGTTRQHWLDRTSAPSRRSASSTPTTRSACASSPPDSARTRTRATWTSCAAAST